jgi:GWxTD domain-containing protein
MRKFLLLLIPLLFATVGNAKKLEAYFAYSTFYSSESGPYIETYLSVVGGSLIHKAIENNKFQGKLEVIYIFYQEDEVKNFKKFNLLSPILNDTLNYSNFLDQQRLQLPNGKYMLEIQITDLNSTDPKPVSSLKEIEVNYSEEKIEISQIEFVESFKKVETPSILTKSGVDIIPYVSDFYPDNLNKIKFYAEIYNTKKLLGENDMYLLKYFIERYETSSPIASYNGFIRQNTSEVNVILREFDIEKLATGNYNLVVEVRNKQNEILASKSSFFQRSNPDIKISIDDLASIDLSATFAEGLNNRDTLNEYVKCLRPISDPLERNFVDNNIKTIDDDMLKKFFYSFWYKRNELTPSVEWKEYLQKVKNVEEEFGTQTMRGYETDRGRVYLQYGPPNHMTKRYSEPSSYPYEIWQYYKTNIRSDSRFVFYNPNLGSDNFELLHSNVYGELRDYRWQARLQKRNDQNPDLDSDRSSDHFGGEVDNFFENPR